MEYLKAITEVILKIKYMAHGLVDRLFERTVSDNLGLVLVGLHQCLLAKYGLKLESPIG